MGAKIDIPTLEWLFNGKMNYLMRSLYSSYMEYTTEKGARELLTSVVYIIRDYWDLGHQTQNFDQER